MGELYDVRHDVADNVSHAVIWMKTYIVLDSEWEATQKLERKIQQKTHCRLSMDFFSMLLFINMKLKWKREQQQEIPVSGEDQDSEKNIASKIVCASVWI